MMIVGQIRQGDVLLVPVDVQPPADCPIRDEAVLALGETTGHAHRLGGAVMDWTASEQRYVRIVGMELGTLTHEDHDPAPAAVVIPEQTYRVVPQQEWDLSGQWRKVRD